MPLASIIPPKTYAATVQAVYSGDDLILFLDIGFEGMFARRRARLYGVDTPNAVNAADTTEAGQIRRMVRDLVMGRNAQFEVVSSVSRSLIGILIVEAGPEHNGVLNLNEHLKSLGYVYKQGDKL